MRVSCIFLVIKSDEKEMNKKRMCVCVCGVLFVQLFMLSCKKKYKIKKCVFFANGQINVFQKFILDLITSLLNLENLADIKANRKINSWELTINFR